MERVLFYLVVKCLIQYSSENCTAGLGPMLRI